MPPTESETGQRAVDTVRQLGSSCRQADKALSGKLSANNEDDTGLFPAAEGCVTKSLPPEAGSSASLTEGVLVSRAVAWEARRGNLSPALMRCRRLELKHPKHAAKVLNG